MPAQPQANFSAEIDKAVGLYHSGEFTRATNLCRRVLSTQPQHSRALHLLGVIEHNAGHYAEAVDLIGLSIKIHPNVDRAWTNLGLAYSALGQHEQALAAYQRALALNPLSAAATLNLGMALSALGRLQEAVQHYDRAIQIQPDLPEAHYNLGNGLWALGQLFEAEHSYRRALALKPDFAEAYLNLANTLLDLDEVPAALDCCQRALKLKPDLPEAHYSLGNGLRDAGQLGAAISSYKRVLELEPNHIAAHLALGSAHKDAGALSEALESYRQALAISPESSQAQTHIDNVLRALDAPAASSAHKEDAAPQEPLLAEALSNLGNAALAAGHVEKALAFFDRALALKPDQPELLHNKSLALLVDGQLEKAWPLYEYRPALRNTTQDYGCSIWEGQSLQGKRLLLLKEQGLGDQIQFLRFVPVLAAMGAEIDVVLDPPLRRLAATVPGIARVLATPPAYASYDYWSFLMSVPYRLGTQLDSIPKRVPYLAAEPDAVDAWAMNIQDFAQGRRRVGLVWAGSTAHINNRNRSIPLRALAPLAQVQGIALIILQQDAIPEALAQVFRDTEVLLAAEQCKEFADTAAAIMNLDLVISVDTAVAHLAGALGCPVWTLLPCNRDWRWLLERNDSPWYPSMRLFRQREYGQWNEVIARVAQALALKA